MNVEGFKIKLHIDEPWDAARIIDGRIEQIYRSDAGGVYFTIEDTATGGMYVVSSRYEAIDLRSVFSGENVVVAIALPITRDFNLRDLDLHSNVEYYGIGSIELAETNQSTKNDW